MSSRIVTFTGRWVDPLALTPDDIDILDIAAGLSKMCRFNGHSREYFSVAQHSVLVSQCCERSGADVRTQLRGLLHDGSEAYIADISRPVKHSPTFNGYRQVEATIQRAIYTRFGLVDDAAAIATVVKADDLMLSAEFRDLIPQAITTVGSPAWSGAVPRIRPLLPERAELLFLRRFTALTGGRA